MDLQIEALQNFGYKILTQKLESSFKEITKNDSSVRLQAGHLFLSRSVA
jgi:hypothetical protein